MKIKILQHEVKAVFEFSDYFQIFHSSCIVKDQEFVFSRLVSNHDWHNTRINVNDVTIGFGEDPRAFNFFGMPACYSIRFVGQKFRPFLYFYSDYWQEVELNLGIDLPAGKNWGPFTYKNDLYFVHEISPFRLLRYCAGQADLEFEQPLPSKLMPIDCYSVLSGGCNGLQIDEDRVIGFGHSNHYISGSNGDLIRHRPFGWLVDMKNKNAEILELEYDWDVEFNIIDPTAFLLINNEYFLMTCETETIWHNPNQFGRICIYPIEITND